MAEFSVTAAVGSGFDLISRRPLSVMAWGLVYALIIAPPLGLFAWSLAGDLPDILSGLQQSFEPGDVPPWILKLQGKVLILQPLVLLISLVSRAALSGAVFRGVLEPEDRAFASLRFGKSELWLMLLYLAMDFVLGFFIFTLIVGGLIVGGLGWLLGGLAPEPWTGWLRALFILAAIGGVIFTAVVVPLRFLLAAPMTFAAKEFRLFESWTLTRGQAGRLFGVVLLLFLVSLVVGLVFDILVFAGAGSALSSVAAFGASDHPDLSKLPAILAALAPVAGVVILISLVLTGPISAIFLAPWAFIYRALSADAKPYHPPVF
jgi:hypothetical protein